MKFIRLQRNADTSERGGALPAELNNVDGGALAPKSERVELTFGEKAVGLTFNPGASDEVNNIKRAAASFIDTIYASQKIAESEGNGEKIAMCKLAIRDAQTAQMWAVKAVTWQY